MAPFLAGYLAPAEAARLDGRRGLSTKRASPVEMMVPNYSKDSVPEFTQDDTLEGLVGMVGGFVSPIFTAGTFHSDFFFAFPILIRLVQLFEPITIFVLQRLRADSSPNCSILNIHTL